MGNGENIFPTPKMNMANIIRAFYKSVRKFYGENMKKKFTMKEI